MPHRHVLTLLCPDRPGIVHTVSGALLEVGGNIIDSAQFGDPDTGLFCLRMVVDAGVQASADIDRTVRERLGGFASTMVVRRLDDRPRIMVLVSKFDHCLVDLLYRWRNGEIRVDIPLIGSNHPDCESVADQYGIPYVHLPVTKATKAAQEAEILRLVDEHRIELVVLARYMQILSDELCRELAGRAINIHHSFLPGFKGARPYHQAHDRGVKLVGATAHYVTAELDEGPIIEQDVVRVTHAQTAEQLTRMGQDVERMVLSRAVRSWAENRILLVGHKTVVFP
jgi:formyltetrahydrofolate deformylase